jgi:hypothetical protein
MGGGIECSQQWSDDFDEKRIMKCPEPSKPTHVSKANIFLDMGFSASEASVLKIKSKIFSAVLVRVRTEGYTRAQLVENSGGEPADREQSHERENLTSEHREVVAVCTPTASPNECFSATDEREGAAGEIPCRSERASCRAESSGSSPTD